MVAEDPLKKPFILKNLRDIVLIAANKASFKHSLIHRLLAEYMELCTDTDAVAEMVDAVKERLMEIAHTRDGARVCVRCVWNANAKDRKAVVKEAKGLAPKLAKEEYGHWVLLALFDCVDDTVLLKKTVVKELLDNLHDVCSSKYGMKVLHYLVHKRNCRIFPKEVCDMLALGDSNPHSKKDPNMRRNELKWAVVPQILQYLANRMEEFVHEPKKVLFVLSVMQNATAAPESVSSEVEEGRRSCFESLASLAAEEFVPCNLEGGLHLVEHPQSHFLLIQLLKLDRILREESRSTFGEVLCRSVGEEKMAAWTSCNKGCFVLLGVFESGEKLTEECVKRVVEPLKKKLAEYSFPAAALLLKKAL